MGVDERRARGNIRINARVDDLSQAIKLLNEALVELEMARLVHGVTEIEVNDD